MFRDICSTVHCSDSLVTQHNNPTIVLIMTIDTSIGLNIFSADKNTIIMLNLGGYKITTLYNIILLSFPCCFTFPIAIQAIDI